VALRAVRVITEVAAVDRPFDYALTERTAHVALGDRVRVNFHNRSVRAWVVGEADPGRELKALTKWLGYGPPPRLLELLEWASERWCAPLSRLLAGASPKRLVTTLPIAPVAEGLAEAVRREACELEPGLVQMAPTTDPMGLLVHAYETCRSREGSLVVLVPSEAWARRLRGRLEQRGCAVASGEGEWDRMRAGWPVIVGARGAALAPAPRLAGAVVFDADDALYRSEAAPTWDAVSMLRERCVRDGAPLWLASMLPSPVLVNDRPFQRDTDLVGGWPRVVVVDRRRSDPHEGALARVALDSAHRALDEGSAVAVAVVLQRLGTGRLLACVRCGELTRCAVCGLAEHEVDDVLSCREGHERRAKFCRSCGATNLKRVRSGVSTLARDVAAQLAQPVSEVTSVTAPDAPLERVVVGTEAILQRVRRCGVVIFADFDQYLLAPRDTARREAVQAVGRAGRLVGGRRDGRGSVVLQTRRGDDLVVRSLREASFDELIDDDIATARLLELAPYGAWAEVTGEGASVLISELDRSELRVSASDRGFVVHASDPMVLAHALRAAPRPAASVRIAVQ